MIRNVSLTTLALVLALAGAASAAGAVLPLASPPVSNDPTATSIFEALMAISRAEINNPSAAQAASFPYAAAIQQYNAGDTTRAQASALEAVMRANTSAPLPTPHPPFPLPPSVSPGAPAQFPLLANIQQAEREERLALARRAMLTCGPTTGTVFAAVSARYATAVAETLAGQSDALNANVQAIVDQCASALAATTASTEHN